MCHFLSSKKMDRWKYQVAWSRNSLVIVDQACTCWNKAGRGCGSWHFIPQWLGFLGACMENEKAFCPSSNGSSTLFLALELADNPSVPGLSMAYQYQLQPCSPSRAVSGFQTLLLCLFFKVCISRAPLELWCLPLLYQCGGGRARKMSCLGEGFACFSHVWLTCRTRAKMQCCVNLKAAEWKLLG